MLSPYIHPKGQVRCANHSPDDILPWCLFPLLRTDHHRGHFQPWGRGLPLPDEYSPMFTGDGPGSSSYTRPPDNIQLHAVPYNYRCDSGGLWRCLRHAALLLTSQWYTFLRIDSKWPSWIRTSEKQVFLQFWGNTSVYGFLRLYENTSRCHWREGGKAGQGRNVVRQGYFHLSPSTMLPTQWVKNLLLYTI